MRALGNAVIASIALATLYVSSASADEPSADGRGLVRLHIDTNNRNVQLRRHLGSFTALSGNMWVHTSVSDIVCRAPCDVVVDGRNGQEFYFSGSGVTDSGRFDFIDLSGDVTVRVNAGSQAVRTTGQVFTYGGLGVFGFGALWYALATSSVNQYKPGGSFPDANLYASWKDQPTVGAACMVIGGLVSVAGIVMWATSGTGYDFAPRGGAAVATLSKIASAFSPGGMAF